MKKLIIFIGIVLFLCSFSYGATTTGNWHGTALPDNINANQDRGFNITIHNASNIVWLEKENGAACTECSVYGADLAFIDNGSYVGDNCTLNASVPVGTAYVFCGNNGVAYNIKSEEGGGAFFPDTDLNLTWVYGAYLNAGVPTILGDNLQNIVGIGIEANPAPVSYNAPNVTLSYPTNQTVYNNYNGSIILVTDVTSNCSLNNTGWVHTGINSTRFHFLNSSATDNNYLIEFNCSHTLDATKWSSGMINFTIDTTAPTINFNSPQNTTRFLTNSMINLSIDFIDANAIWQFNITIRNSTNDIVFNNFTTNISISQDIPIYNFSQWLALEVGNHTMSVTVWDAHTDEELKSYSESKYTENQYNVIDQNINEESIKIFSSYPITTIQESDRILYSVGSNTEYILQSSKPIYYLPNSKKYDCHIITGNIWHDCNGLKNGQIEIMDSYNIKIKFDKVLGQVSESTGVLNNITQEIWFFAGDDTPETTITNPLDNATEPTLNINFTWSTVDLFDTMIYSGFLDNVSIFTNISALFYNHTHADNGTYSFRLLTCETTGNLICVNDTVNYTILVPLVVSPDTSEITHNANLYFLFGLWIALVCFSIWLKKFALLIFTTIYGIFLTIWLFNYLPLDSGFMVVTFGIINVWLLYHALFSKGDSVTG